MSSQSVEFPRASVEGELAAANQRAAPHIFHPHPPLLIPLSYPKFYGTARTPRSDHIKTATPTGCCRGKKNVLDRKFCRARRHDWLYGSGEFAGAGIIRAPEFPWDIM
jgi:hypothetical protein